MAGAPPLLSPNAKDKGPTVLWQAGPRGSAPWASRAPLSSPFLGCCLGWPPGMAAPAPTPSPVSLAPFKRDLLWPLIRLWSVFLTERRLWENRSPLPSPCRRSSCFPGTWDHVRHTLGA